MDVHGKETRSYNMSRIRSRDTQPEIRLRKLLWLCGLRGYRLHSRLPGRPDIAYSRHKVAVFIDGCFWHGCPHCGDGRAPDSNCAYWSKKLAANRERDARRTHELGTMGWTVLRLWEHEVMKEPELAVSRIAQVLRKSAEHSSSR